MTITYLFPGQGSQKKGMGESLFEQFPEQTHLADEILGYSIKDICLNDPDNSLTQTQLTQPALFVVSALTFLARKKESGVTPNFVAGHSVGEYAALFAAEVFDFATGLKLVAKRGEIMSKVKNGAMAAIIGMPSNNINDLLQKFGLHTIDIVNFNSKDQTVIAGPEYDIEKAGPIFKEAGVRLFVKLNVSGAFHSRYMNDAAAEFKEIIDQHIFANPKIPVISNLQARPYPSSGISEILSKQINNSVKWYDSMKYILDHGDTVFEEIGPGKVLTSLARQIKASLKN